MGVTRIMHNSPNRGVNYHIFQNKGNYPVVLIYAEKWMIIQFNFSYTFLQNAFNFIIFHCPDIFVNRNSGIGTYQVKMCISISNIDISLKVIIYFEVCNQIIMLSLSIFSLDIHLETSLVCVKWSMEYHQESEGV